MPCNSARIFCAPSITLSPLSDATHWWSFVSLQISRLLITSVLNLTISVACAERKRQLLHPRTSPCQVQNILRLHVHIQLVFLVHHTFCSYIRWHHALYSLSTMLPPHSHTTVMLPAHWVMSYTCCHCSPRIGL